MAEKEVALIGDIHANERALLAVHADIKTRLGLNASIYSFGDVIGYGPKPFECSKWVMTHAKWSLMGNHDQAVMFDPDHFNPLALRAIQWTRSLFVRHRDADRLFEWYGTELPTKMDLHGALCVHASPRRPIDEYIKPEDIYKEKKMAAIAAAMGALAFCGHTHIPGVFDLSGTPQFIESSEINGVYSLNQHAKAVVNIGSVGQPRDHDTRACYVIFDPDARTIEYCRVEYDIALAIKDYEGITELADEFAQRLRFGK